MSRAYRWLADRARELANACRRVAQGKGQHGRPQLNALIKHVQQDQPEEAALHAETAASHVQLCTAVEALGQTLEAQSPEWEALREFADLFNEKAEAYDDVAKAKEGPETAESKKRWKEWVQTQLDSGAGALHRWSKVPVEWRPTTALSEEGRVTADPMGLLKAQEALWSDVWKAKSTPQAQPLRRQEPLPLLKPEEIRSAALGFKATTAMSVDGFHVRHLALLSDDALEVLARLVHAMESVGRVPPQLRTVMVILLEKPAGGFRPIGIFSAVYRVWGKARRPYCVEWEAKNQRDYYASGKGKSPTDAVWRQALLAETTVTDSDQVAASVLWDVSKFYEQFRHDWLRERAARAHFPAALLELSLHMYSCARHLVLGGLVATALYPSQGVIAGCHNATTLVRVYTLQPFDDLRDRCGTVRFDFYIDDLTTTHVGSREQVVMSLAKATGELKKVVEDELGAQVASDKSGVVASDNRTLEALRHRLGDLAGPKVKSAKNLGVDYTAGRPRRAQGPQSARAKRIRAAKERRHRLQRLAKAAGWRAYRIATAGVLPSATYGAEVNGISNYELLSVRRACASALRPAAPGRSLDAVLLVHGDPTWKCTAAPILRLHKEVWRSHTRTDPDAMDLTAIRKAWRKAQPMETKSWAAVRGPLSACALSLQRLGWTVPVAEAPLVLVNEEGQRLILTERSPALLAKDIQASATRLLEKAVALQTKDPELEGHRAFMEPLRACLRKKNIGRHEKGVLRSVACNAVWTQTRLASKGCGLDSTKCPLCNAAEDTIHHRVWWCPKSEAERNAHASKLLVRAARDAGPTSAYYNRAIGKHPAHRHPEPCQMRDTEWVFEACSDVLPPLAVQGDVYVDGSCSRHVVREMNRAGWAVVCVDEQGEILARAYGPVCAPLPQTSQAAEFVAFAAAVRLAAGPTSIFEDCSNVIRAAHADAAQTLSERRPHAGIMKDARAEPGWKHIREVAKVKAHVKEQEVSDPLLKRHAICNDYADATAKEGKDMHPSLSQREHNEVVWYVKRLEVVARTIGETVKLWPSSKQHNGKVRRSTASLAPAAKPSKQAAGGATVPAVPQPPTAALGDEGRGQCMRDMWNPAWVGPGHSTEPAGAGSEDKLVCIRCGAVGGARSRTLAAKCKGAPPTGTCKAQARTRALNMARRG